MLKHSEIMNFINRSLVNSWEWDLFLRVKSKFLTCLGRYFVPWIRILSTDLFINKHYIVQDMDRLQSVVLVAVEGQEGAGSVGDTSGGRGIGSIRYQQIYRKFRKIESKICKIKSKICKIKSEAPQDRIGLSAKLTAALNVII